MKRKIILGLVGGLCIAVLAGVLSQKVIKENVFADGCNHVGNHYSELKKGTFVGGTKEYWVCCKCHEHFLEKPEGQWADIGEAEAVPSTDDRYIKPTWYRGGSSVDGAEITDGWTITGLKDNTKHYACYNEPLKLNGLSFTLQCDNLTNNYDDCIGFYIQQNVPSREYQKATKPIVFTLWGTSSNRNQISGYLSHDENPNSTTIAKSITNPSGTKGFSKNEGPLLIDYSSNKSVNLTFTFTIINAFMKMEIISDSKNKFDSSNYNVGSDNTSVYTYVYASTDIPVSASTLSTCEMYLGFFGKRYSFVGNNDSISVLNLNTAI